MRIRIYSQGLVEFYSKIIGLPLGKKNEIKIPSCIWADKRFIRACLRGIIDTDGSFQLRIRNYPQIKLACASKRLIKDCKKAFKLVGIETSIKTDCVRIHNVTKRKFITNYLYLSGRKKISKYIKLVGFSNQNNILRLQKYKGGPKGISTPDPKITPNL